MKSRVKNSAHRARLELAADLRAHDVQLHHLHARIDSPERALKPRAHLRGTLLGIWRQADRDVARGAEVLHLRIVETSRRERVRTASTLAARVKIDLGVHPAGEVDRKVQAAGEERPDRDDHDTAESAYHTLRVAMNGKLV